MTRIVLFFLIVLSSSLTIANNDRIAAVVNKMPITERQVFDRKNLLIKMHGATNLDETQSEIFKKISMNSLVEDALLESEAGKFKIIVSDKDIDNFLLNVEKSRNLKPGFFKENFNTSNGVYDSFIKKVRGEIIKSRLINEYVARSVSVSEDEVADIAMAKARKDADLALRKISSSDNSDKSYKLIMDFRKENKTCNTSSKSRNIEIETMNTKLSKLARDDSDLISTLKEGQYSAINDRDGKLIIYQVCSKKVGISKEEEENLMHYIGNKKVNLKMQRYLESLKKRSYIKYFD